MGGLVLVFGTNDISIALKGVDWSLVEFNSVLFT
jgi:hypothetical protein